MIYSGVRKYTSTGRKKTKDEIAASYFAKYRVKCKCSHSVFIPYNVDKKICNYCGNYVYRNKKDEFKDMLLRKMKYEREN